MSVTPKVRPGQRQRYPGQARSTTDVGDTLSVVEQFGHRGTIQQVAVPQPVDFPRAEQSPLDAGAGQDLRVLLGALQPRSEQDVGGLAALPTPPTCFT